MSDPFDALIGPLLDREGPYSNRASDRGGPTAWGWTEKEARAAGYSGPMTALGRALAAAMYRPRYWTGPGFDKVAALSVPVAAELFDTGVNMGRGTASIWLQRALNILNRRGRDYPDIKVDGHIGSGTIAALAGLLKARGVAGETVLLKALNCLQGARYIELAERDETQEDNEFGWLANRVGLA